MAEGRFARFFGTKAAEAKPVARPRIRRGARAEYDGATIGRRATAWRRTIRDANGELTPEVMVLLRGIARDLVRNNPFAARGVSAIANNLVGTGITFQVYRNGVIDDRLNARARLHFDRNSCDASGRHDLYGMQLQAARTIVESGEVLVRRRWRRTSDGLPLPFQLQVLEPDYLDSSKNGYLGNSAAPGAPFQVNGIEFSPIGKRSGYWLYAGHPGAVRIAPNGSSLIKADDIAHVYRADRPEQERGATWFAPIVLRTKDFADYEDAQLTRQKIASAFAGFIVPDNNDAIVGTDDTADVDGAALTYVEPGTISVLPDGKTIEFSDPPGVEGYGEFARISLLAIAVGLGVPYEALTGDLKNVNFSSGRMGWLEFQRSLAAWQWTMFIPQFCGAVERWLLDAFEAIGEDITGVSLEWTPPGREMIDPSSEVKATRDAIRAGLDTISAAAKRRGVDPDRFLAEWAADAKRLDALGLIFDSDPRKVTAVGNPAGEKQSDKAGGEQ